MMARFWTPTRSAVVSVVDGVGPSVVSITTGRRASDGRVGATGAGSGVIVAPDGYVLTNNHVVQDASRLAATLTDGRTLEAVLIGEDASIDLALIRLSAADLPAAVLGRSASSVSASWWWRSATRWVSSRRSRPAW